MARRSPASHAQSPEAVKALADLVVDDADKREAAIAVIGGTRDPKWLEFLAALRDGNVYARGKSKDAEVVVGGAKTTKGDAEVIEIASAYDRKPLGAVPLAGLVEIAADRRLRIAIKPFLDADETRLQLAESRSGGAPRRGHEARPPGGGRCGAGGRGGDHEGVRARVRHALQEALALIRLANGDPGAAHPGGAQLGDLHSSCACPRCRSLRPIPAPHRSSGTPPGTPSARSSAGAC